MDHLHMFNLIADLTKAYDEPLYLSANLFKSAKESYSEDRAAFAFKNSFGKDVPGVSGGATYDKEDKEDKEKARKKKKKKDKDLDKAVTGWDVAEAALWFTPVGAAARGAKVAHKIASVGFKPKQLMASIRKLYGANMAKDYSAAIAKGTRHVEKFLVGLANTKPMQQLNSFTDDALKTIASLNSGKYGSGAVKSVGDYLKFANRKDAGLHRFLGRTSKMTQQGLKTTPAQRVITNLELSAAKGSPSVLFSGTPLARYIKGGTKGGPRAGGVSSLRRHESYRKKRPVKGKRRRGRIRVIPGVAGGKPDTQSVTRRMMSESAEGGKGSSLYVKAGGSGKGGVAGASVKGKGSKLIVSAGKGKASKVGGRYRYSGERPETWKEVHAKAQERA